MPTFAAGALGLYEQTLSANTLSTVTFSDLENGVTAIITLYNYGTATIYVRIGGTVAVADPAALMLPPASQVDFHVGANTSISLISASAGSYSITRSTIDNPQPFSGASPSQPLPPGSNTIGNVRIQDPSANNIASVKAAGVAPTGAETALVTTLSPTYVSAVLGAPATLAASTNATNVRTFACSLFVLDVTNYSGATIYVKLFNKASAPVPGTDVPVLTIAVAASTTLIQEFGFYGKRFPTGFGYTVTGAAADTDTTAIAAGAKIGLTYL